jgi:rhomboid protease GluP
MFKVRRHVLVGSSYASWCLALGLVAVWLAAAVYLDQAFLATQRGSQLLQLGAVNGDLLGAHEYWRLLVSQFLHVHFLHMLFNALCILVVGSAVEKVFYWHGLLIVYLVGGTAGLIASVVFYPTEVSSGTSQALMALCAAAILVGGVRVRLIAVTIVAIQIALDVYVSGAIKMGHSVGFAAGLLIALGILIVSRLMSPTHSTP